MKIKFYKAMWGMPAGEDIGSQFLRIAEAGYDGIEINIWNGMPEGFESALAGAGLEWTAQLISHEIDEMLALIDLVAPFKPKAIVSHSGRDSFSFEQGREFLLKMQDRAAELGLRVFHETHRARLLFSPMATRQYLEAFPEMRINADLSHWVCVCERLLDDLEETVELAISRASYVHARIGYEEGPQVSDPRAPEFEKYRSKFYSWWDRIKEAREKDGTDELVFVPEYGPPAYQQVLPYTRQPTTDLWDVCLWQANELRKRWGLPVPGEA